jgi:hypothetical protein
MAIRRDPADAMFSKAVRMSRGMKCECCQRTDGQMELAHIFGRRHKSVRWDTLNGLCLSHTCHRYYTENPVEFTRFLEGYVGRGYLDILYEKKERIQKTNVAYRKDVAAHYRREIKLMEAGQHELVSFQ